MITRSLSLAVVACAALSLAVTGCDKKTESGAAAGGKAGAAAGAAAGDAPAAAATTIKSADDGLKAILAAVVDGKVDKMKAMIMTEADLDGMLKAAGDKIPEKRREGMKGQFPEQRARLDKAFARIVDEAKASKIDLSKLTIANVESKEKEDMGAMIVRVNADLKDGDKAHKIRFQAARIDRGLVFVRPPRIRWSGGETDVKVKAALKEATDSIKKAGLTTKGAMDAAGAEKAAIAAAAGKLGLEDAPPADPNNPMVKMFDHQEKLLDLMEGAKGDSAAAEAAVGKYLTDNKAELDELKVSAKKFAEEMQGDPSKAMAIMKSVQGRMQGMMGRMMKITQDKNMQGAMKKISDTLKF